MNQDINLISLNDDASKFFAKAFQQQQDQMVGLQNLMVKLSLTTADNLQRIINQLAQCDQHISKLSMATSRGSAGGGPSAGSAGGGPSAGAAGGGPPAGAAGGKPSSGSTGGTSPTGATGQSPSGTAAGSNPLSSLSSQATNLMLTAQLEKSLKPQMEGWVKDLKLSKSDKKEDIQDTADKLWKDVESIYSSHYQKILTGAESFSKAYLGIFQDMAKEIAATWANKALTDVVNWMFGKDTPNFNFTRNGSNWTFGSTVPASNSQWSFGSTASASNSQWTFRKASGGSVDQSSVHIVGEQGPELFVPDTAGTIIPNNRLNGNRSVTSPAAAATAPNVTVNVINQSGSPIEPVRQETKMNGDEYVINVVIDSISRNRYGMRDMISATAKR